MHCPDCSHILTPVPLGLNGEVNQSFRCYRCGGFWLESWLANRVKSKLLDKWPQSGITRSVAGNGSDECPLHVGTTLERFRGDSVPADMVVKKCRQCNWWWFPGNTLFEFKPAQEAKINYHRLWNLPSTVGGLMLPLVALVVLLAGGVIAVTLVRQQQYISSNASSPVNEFTAVYVGNDQIVVSFKSSTLISQIEYRQVGDADWMTVPISGSNGFYQLEIQKPEESANYEFRIIDKIYR